MNSLNTGVKMAIYDPADDDRLEDVNMALPVEITLSVDDTGDVPDDLYDYLLDQFIEKAKSMGHDVVNTPNLVLGSWTIKAVLEEI